MEISDLITNVLLPIGGGIGGWFVGRRRRNADVESAELKNVQTSLNIYIQMLGDMKQHVDALEKRVNDLLSENTVLRANNLKLKLRVEALETQLKGTQK